MIKKYWVAVLAFLLVAVSSGIALLAVNQPPIGASIVYLEVAATLLSWSLFILQFLYNGSDRFYLLVNKGKFWATNETTRWNLRVELRGIEGPNALEIAFREFRANQQLNPRIWHSDETKKILDFDGYAIRLRSMPDPALALEPDGMSELIDIEISDLQLPYRVFRERLEREIIPLLRSTVEALRPGSEKYSVKIAFRSGNPYFGFFVRKLELPQVVSFTCDILETEVDGRQQAVAVRKDRIEITADNVVALQYLSVKYVTLAS